MYGKYKGLIKGWGFVAGGSIFVLAGIALLLWSFSTWVGTTRTQGTVVQIDPPQGKGNSSRIPVVEYQVDGRKFTCKAEAGSSANQLQVGDHVDVLFKANEPSLGQVDFFAERWILPVGFIGIGSFFVLAGAFSVWVAVYTYPLPRKE